MIRGGMTPGSPVERFADMYKKAVIHFNDGTKLHGCVEDITPGMRFVPRGEPGLNLLLQFKDIKAILFVKDTADDRSGLPPGTRVREEKIVVEFKDGERVRGCLRSKILSALNGFLIYPADICVTYEKAFILMAAVAAIIT